jgi:hypothetical protein
MATLLPGFGIEDMKVALWIQLQVSESLNPVPDPNDITFHGSRNAPEPGGLVKGVRQSLDQKVGLSV